MTVTVDQLPRLRSERALRTSRGWVLALSAGALVLFAVALTGRDTSPWQWATFGCYALFFGVTAVQWRALSAWRSVELAPGERLLWGTAAPRVLPTGGAGHDGLFVLTDRELRHLPSAWSRARGTRRQSWPVGTIVGVRVTPVDDRRRWQGGRWVQVDVDDGPAVVVLTAESHLVADELSTALHGLGLLPRR